MAGQAEDLNHFILQLKVNSQEKRDKQTLQRQKPAVLALSPTAWGWGWGWADNGTYLGGSLGCVVRSMRGKHTQLGSGRKDLLVLLLRTLLRRLPRRAKGAGGEEGGPARSAPARLRAGGAGPKDARASRRRPFQAPGHCPLV